VMHRRICVISGFAFTINSIAGCAGNTRASSQNGLKNERFDTFSGRISLVIEADAQASLAGTSLSGSFELRGNAQTGELDLLTPLGQIAVQLRWQPGLAQLIRGTEVQTYASAQALLLQATGVKISTEQLFSWLQNDAPSTSVSSDGWQVDLSSRAQGRIMARRSQPTTAVLRIVLEQP
jgi:outer membrane lipoprotein LolB